MQIRKEALFSDLGGLCTPQENISSIRNLSTWNSVPYETANVTGTMLLSMQNSRPQNVELAPKLTGWYRIFVGIGAYGISAEDTLNTNVVNMKLTRDGAFMHLAPSGHSGYAYHAVQESFWRCADMTGQNVEIAKHPYGAPTDAMLAWVRFVPMEQDEVDAHLADLGRTDTKRIYATNDMHGMLGNYGLRNADDWHTTVQEYVESDVEWLSVENITIFDGEPSTGSAETFAFSRPCDEIIQERLKKDFTPEMLTDLAAYGKKQGIKMCVSMRMGAWGLEFPYDQMYFVNAFAEAHQELRCVDRDGSPIDALSYMYEPVQEYILNQFVTMAGTGCDAVEMIFSRGVPYVLFEQPFVDRFLKEYGEDPRYLPLDDARVTEARCQVVTELVRKLRARLDEVYGAGKVRLHARAQFSIWDCRHVGVDLETWAKEGLIHAVISYPQRIRELLEGDVWQDDNKERLDLEKYAAYVRNSPERSIFRRQDFRFMPPMADSHGVLQGPATMEERVAEFMELENKYGVTVYLEIMPRFMTPEEYKERALELYRCGCNHISLWDTYARVPRKADWSMIGRLGHKDELEHFESGEGTLFSKARLLKIGGKDVSRYIPAWGG